MQDPCNFLLDESSCGKIDSFHKLPVRKKMKNIVGKMEYPLTETWDTTRNCLCIVEKNSGTKVARAISEAQISPFWVEGDD